MVHVSSLLAAHAANMASSAAPPPTAPFVAAPEDYAKVVGAGVLCVLGAVGVRYAMNRHLESEVALKDKAASRNYGSNAGEEGASVRYREYPERWLMLGVYALCIMTVTILSGSLMSSQVPATKLFSIKAYDIVTMMSVLTFLMLPGTIFSELLFHRVGIKNTCVVGISLSAAAAWAMWYATYAKSWALEVVGMVSAGLAGPLLGNACTALSSSWFSIDSRNFPTAVGSGGAGAVASALFNPYAVTFVQQLGFEFFIIAVVTTVVAFLYAILYKESPPTPPSAEEPSAERTMRVSTTASLKAMATDINVFILLYCFALDGYGFGLILVTSILTDIGYGQHEANLVIAAASIGSMSSMVFAPVADRLKRRDERWPTWLMQICQALSLLSTFALSLVLKPGMFYLILFFFFLIGVTTSAAAPFLLELIAEITYPAPESLSAGVALTVFGLATFGFVQLSQVMKDDVPKGDNAYESFFWLQNVLFLISVLLLSFVFKADLKRTECALSGEREEEHDLLGEMGGDV